MSRLTKCGAGALFGPALSQAYRGRSGDLGFDFTSGRSGLPDDLKPPVIAGLMPKSTAGALPLAIIFSAARLALLRP